MTDDRGLVAESTRIEVKQSGISKQTGRCQTKDNETEVIKKTGKGNHLQKNDQTVQGSSKKSSLLSSNDNDGGRCVGQSCSSNVVGLENLHIYVSNITYQVTITKKPKGQDFHT